MLTRKRERANEGYVTPLGKRKSRDVITVLKNGPNIATPSSTRRKVLTPTIAQA
jgi:hypothetical protein